MNHTDFMKEEIELLLYTIRKRYGYDFTNYSESSLERRVLHRLKISKFDTISDMIPKIMHDPGFFETLLQDLSISVTEMFRNPLVFKYIREKLVPYLKTYSRINIWHAGCSTGQEAYSMAILLLEEGLLERSHIYATDFNNQSLDIAQKGSYSIKNLDEYKSNYLYSGGTKELQDYFKKDHSNITINSNIAEKVSFNNHNLSGDHPFTQMHLILCRNVMIYFNQEMRNRCLGVLKDSLEHRCFLVLGNQESLDASKHKDSFEEFSSKYSIYRKSRIPS